MVPKRFLRAACAVLAVSLVGGSVILADTVETNNGSRIVGKVTQISGGSVTVSTDYAGVITIKQSEVVTISTDAPVAVRLASGTRFDGQVAAGSGGTIQIAGSDGIITTTVAKIAASWEAGAQDPEVVALERHWIYEATMDVVGKSGNKDQLGTAASVRATLRTPTDTLQFYSAYDRQVTDNEKSADQFKAGADYQNNFSGKFSWYVRNEGGFDRVKDIELYNIAAAGFGFDLIKQPKHTLTTRAGLSFRYEGYKNILTTDVKSAGLDFGLAHELGVGDSKLINRVSYVPSFDDFANYRINQESFYEIPLSAPSWKLRLGLRNDYNSSPGLGVVKLDTAYFTRLVLNWQ